MLVRISQQFNRETEMAFVANRGSDIFPTPSLLCTLQPTSHFKVPVPWNQHLPFLPSPPNTEQH